MINLADKLTAKTVEGILADSNEIKYTKEMGDTAKAETVAKELSNLTDSMSGLSNSVTTLSQEFEITQSDIEQLLNKSEQYTDILLSLDNIVFSDTKILVKDKRCNLKLTER